MKLSLQAFAAALVLTCAASPLSAAIPVSNVFDGGGSSSTPEGAIAAAIDDAVSTASAFGFFTCELVGAPEVFPQPPGAKRAFAAQVRVVCD